MRSSRAWSPSQVIDHMNGLYPIIRRVRRPLIPLVEPNRGMQQDSGGTDAKPSVVVKAEAMPPTPAREEKKDALASKNTSTPAQG